MNRLFNRNSIGAKIFGAFLVMGVMIGALGINSYYILSATGAIAIDTYDKPMMAINFARAASVDFAQMQNEALRRKLAPPAGKAAIDKRIDDLTSTFFDDLAIAEERTTRADEHKIIEEIETLVTAWDAYHQRGFDFSDAGTFEKLNDRIIDRFDVLVELKAGSSFVERRKALTTISQFEYVSMGVTGLALLMALALTAFLARSIVRPLQAAARVADRIAGGGFETAIPEGRKDETGILLNSMRVMQTSIKSMMARETAQRRSAETRLYDALESAQEGMMLVDADGRIVVANSRLREFFAPVTHALGEGAPFEQAFTLLQDALVASDDTRFPAFDAAHAAFDVAHWSTECSLPDGRWLRIEASRTSDGGTIIFFADFSELKAREEGFKQAKHEAEVASAAKSTFLANMSHELRTPLNAIIGFSEIISGQIFGAIGNARYADYATDILKSGQRLLNVINDVLEIASSESGTMSADLEALDLGDVLADCADTLAADGKAAGLSVRIDGTSQQLPVIGDRDKLRQIFVNLFSNAVKFTPAGGSVSLVARVTLGRTVSVTLTDTGIGMSAQDIEVALKPFGQVDARLERRFEGTGLGLPLVEAFMKLHKGDMMIDSAPGRGTTITLNFPWHASAAAKEKGRQAI
tara:strand:- start:773 stop:2692 length:1920 start_codon:yes stop_codon:yes gene_type:complete